MPARERAFALLRRASPHLTLTVFALIAAEPLARGQSPCTDDTALHLFRGVEMARLIEWGHFPPRWAPDMALGFGFPLFNYYAPLSALLMAGLHGLGLSFGIALHLLYFAILLASAIGAFVLARDLWGEPAGLVAGVGYLTAPYFAYDILFRGAFAESMGWVWPPFILWALHRALVRRSTKWGLAAAVLYAGLMLTHNNLALLASPLIAAFGAMVAWQQRSARSLALAAAWLGLGLGLAAFFWIPALTERDLVQSDRLLVPPIFTYYTNFITPSELFAPPRPDDPALINPSPARALGLIPAVLSLPAILLAFARRFRDPQSQFAGFFGLCLAGYAFMTLGASQPLWDRIPLLPFVQFPWRMLSIAALCASLLAGAGVAWLGRRAGTVAGVVAVLLLLANLPWWFTRYCALVTDHGIDGLVHYEIDSGTIGTTAKGEFLPVTVRLFPEDRSLAEALSRGEDAHRVDESRLPEGASIEYLALDPLDTRVEIDTPEPFTLVFRNFYFPGWRVSLDGEPAVVRVTPDYGLISFEVPAGRHEARIRFGSTPARTFAEWTSLLSVIAYAGLAIRARREHDRTDEPIAAPGSTPLSLVLLPVLLLVLKLAWIDRVANPWRWPGFDGERVAQAQTPLRADYAGGVSLYGFDLSSESLASGESLDVSLYVAMRQHTERRFWPTFSLEDASGIVWSDDELHVPRWQREPPRTPLWPPAPEAYAQWARQVRVLPGTPPGRYTLWATVFDLDTLQPDSILDEVGNSVAPRIALAEIEVTRPAKPAGVEDLDPEVRVDQTLGQTITLIGYGVDRSEARPGDGLTLTSYWRALASPIGDETITVRLKDSNGASAAEWSFPLIPGFPASEWQTGDAWRAPLGLTLPARLSSGIYRWHVGLDGEDGGALSEIRVLAPDHVWERPEVGVENDARFGGVARLVGHTLLLAPPSPSIILVWQPLAEGGESYSVFMHVSDATGRIVAQSDGVPGTGDRPTTGWLPDEFIVDRHTLPELPPGEYDIFVGLYDPRTGARLTPTGTGVLPDGRVLLGKWTLP